MAVTCKLVVQSISIGRGSSGSAEMSAQLSIPLGLSLFGLNLRVGDEGSSISGGVMHMLMVWDVADLLLGEHSLIPGWLGSGGLREDNTVLEGWGWFTWATVEGDVEVVKTRNGDDDSDQSRKEDSDLGSQEARIKTALGVFHDASLV